MDSEEIGERAFEQRNDRILSMMADNVAEISICSESLFISSSGVDPFYSSCWNTMVSENQPQIQFAHPHYPVVLENQTMGSSSDLVQFTSDSGLVDMVPNIPSFGSGSFSEMVSSFGHIDETGYHSNFPQNQGVEIQRASIDNTDSLEQCLNSEHGVVLGALPNAKRKRKVSVEPSCKNVEVEQRMDQTRDSSKFPKADEKRNNGANSCEKQAKDSSNGAEPSKENYILVRAKRGQATNSHSLAERMRRERISERMRLLQELVPGCDKSTGKAVMLDEIINYVQSLQQQVEFLSMKLATVNPEGNVDLEPISSEDLLYRHGNNATAHGTYPDLSSPHALTGLQFRSL